MKNKTLDKIELIYIIFIFGFIGIGFLMMFTVFINMLISDVSHLDVDLNAKILFRGIIILSVGIIFCIGILVFSSDWFFNYRKTLSDWDEWLWRDK